VNIKMVTLWTKLHKNSLETFSLVKFTEKNLSISKVSGKVSGIWEPFIGAIVLKTKWYCLLSTQNCKQNSMSNEFDNGYNTWLPGAVPQPMFKIKVCYPRMNCSFSFLIFNMTAYQISTFMVAVKHDKTWCGGYFLLKT
jgi:hypothetical protein